MHLPEHVKERNYRIDWDRDVIKPGNALYYACDGTVYTVRDVSPMSFELRELQSGEHWKIGGKELREALYTDFFPLKLTGFYPD